MRKLTTFALGFAAFIGFLNLGAVDDAAAAAAQQRLAPVAVAQAPAAKPAEVAKPAAEPAAKKEAAKQDWSKAGRGYKPLTPERRAHFQALDRKKHGDRIQKAAKNLNLPASFDTRVRSPLPIWDQGSCGSCYLVSTVRTMTDAGVQIGLGKPDGSFMMAAQYGMDSPRDFGGCGGGNGTEVIDWAVRNGWIAEKWVDNAGVSHNDYPAYEARSGRDRTAPGARTWVKGWTWGMVSNSGKPSVADIKAAMVLHGRLNVSLDAGGEFGNGTGTITRLGSSIDHEINMVAYDDAKDGGSFLLENQWGTDWGVNGVRWVTYMAAAAIVDHFWISAGVIPPPPPPGPIPPVPGTIVITSPLTATGTVGASFSYQIVAAGAADFAAAGMPSGLTCNATTGMISGAPDLAGSFSVTISASSPTSAPVTAVLALSVTGGPTPPVPGVAEIDFPQDVNFKAGKYKIVRADAVIGPPGSIVVTGDMTVQQIIDALAGKKPVAVDVKTTEPPVDRIGNLERAILAIMDRLQQMAKEQEQKMSPKK